MASVFRNFRNRIGSYGGDQEGDSDDGDLAKAVAKVRESSQKKDAGSAGPSRGGSFLPGKEDGNAAPSRGGSFLPSRGGSSMPAEVLPGAPDMPVPVRSPKKKATIKDALGRLMGKRKPESIADQPSPDQTPSTSLRPTGSGFAELGQADRQRFIDKVDAQKSPELQQEMQQIIDTSPGVTREEMIKFRDAVLQEAWSVICNGFLKTEYTRFTEVEVRHKKMLQESREAQTAYLREITALKDQLRMLPDGTARFCDVTHFDPMKCIDPEVRPLVEAAVQERMKQCISQAHSADSELNNLVCGFMAKERLEWVARGEAAEEEAKRCRQELLSLEAEAHATESIIDRERKEAQEVKAALEECQKEKDELLADLNAMKELEVEVEKLRKANTAQVQELEELRQEKAKQDDLIDEWEGKRRSRSDPEDSTSPSTTQSTPTCPSKMKAKAPVSANVSTIELLGELAELQDDLQTSPESCVELHKALEILSAKLDSDCLEAAYRCKPRATAASIELLAHRVRTSRKEAALARQCCIVLAEALLCRKGAGEVDAAFAQHKELLQQSTSVATQSMSSMEEPKRRAIHAAVAVLAAAAEAQEKSASSERAPSRGEKISLLPSLKEDDAIDQNSQVTSKESAATGKPARFGSAPGKAQNPGRHRSVTQPLPSLEQQQALSPEPAMTALPFASPSPSPLHEPEVERQASNKPSKKQLATRSVTSELAPVRPGGHKKAHASPGGGSFVIPKKG